MRPIVVSAVVLLGVAPTPAVTRANMLTVRVSAQGPSAIRAIWHPRAGVAGTSKLQQQAPLSNPFGLRTRADSVRRWMDPAARDTVRANAPVVFFIDMTPRPVEIDAVSGDSVLVEAQLVSAHGPVVKARGRAFELDADGKTAVVHVRR